MHTTHAPIDYEPIIQEVYEAILRDGDTAVDIGAHRGRHTLPLARCVGPGGRVIAVEPLPECRDELQQRLAKECPGLVAVVEILPCALSDQPGRAMFVVAENDLAFSGLRRIPRHTPGGTHTLDVDRETLDGICRDRRVLHFIKLDAEGAELQILRGGTACLNRFRPVICFEFGTFSNHEYGVEPAAMADFWAAHDYLVYAITGELLAEADFVRRALKRDIWDYVAVPAEKSSLHRLVRQTLQRPRVNWLAVHAQLHHARDHADVGAQVPPLRRFRGPLRPLARGLARLFLLAARMITVPQRLFNNALLLALQQLTTDLAESERTARERDRRLHELELRLADVEQNLLLLREQSGILNPRALHTAQGEEVDREHSYAADLD